MPALVIIGASGFVGKALIQSSDFSIPIKAVVRKKPSYDFKSLNTVTWYEVDLLNPQVLDEILEKGDIVINTAYIPTNNRAENCQLAENIVSSCVRKLVKRIIHCSTATVVGRVKDLEIKEEIKCNPLTPYEITKLLVEEKFLAAKKQGLEVVVLRPTAIVGPGGQNLQKLMGQLSSGNSFVNYLRASLFQKRNMHLVSINKVCKALIHLTQYEKLENRSVFFVSADNDLNNNYFSVETILREALGLSKRSLPLLPIPLFVLRIFLRIKNNSGIRVNQTFNSDKLLATDFSFQDSLHDTVYEVGRTFAQRSSKE